MCQRRNPQDLDGGEQWQENKTGEKANAYTGQSATAVHVISYRS